MAEAHYRESLALEPQPAVYNDLGFVLERQGMADEAVEMYEKSLELDPEGATAHYNLGSVYVRAQQFERAEGHFRSALTQGADSKVHTGLGFTLWKQGRAKEAMASLEAAIAADPTNAAAYDQLGSIQIEQGKLEEAVETYRRLTVKQPSAAAHEELAGVLTELGQTDEARRQREMATLLKAGAPEARQGAR